MFVNRVIIANKKLAKVWAWMSHVWKVLCRCCRSVTSFCQKLLFQQIIKTSKVYLGTGWSEHL